MGHNLLLYIKNFHDFIAEVIDDLNSDAARFGFGEGAGDVAVEAFPGFFVEDVLDDN
jgi:hypothetical protein